MFWVALFMILLALLQVPFLVKQKQWGDLAGYGLVWIMAATYAMLVAGRVPLPRPVEILRPLFQALYRLLGLEVEV